ncbi:MAG: four helix bundle protein [Candidatus Scalinduaceae bacterium]
MNVDIKSVEDLDVFKMAHELVLKIYKITKKFPDEEKFGLVSQMRRAVSSVPMNLMEGGHRLSSKEYRQFAGIANGSIGEFKYHILLSKDLKYLSNDIYHELRNTAEEISKMLMGLIKSLSKKQ